MKHFFTSFILITALSGCGNGDIDTYKGRHGMFSPRTVMFGYMPQGDDDYSQGMRDGCNSAFSIVGQGAMKSNYDDIYMDVNRNVENDDYNKGWNAGLNYCTYVSDPDPI